MKKGRKEKGERRGTAMKRGGAGNARREIKRIIGPCNKLVTGLFSSPFRLLTTENITVYGLRVTAGNLTAGMIIR